MVGRQIARSWAIARSTISMDSLYTRHRASGGYQERQLVMADSRKPSVEEARHHAEEALRSFEKIGEGEWTPQDMHGHRCALDVLVLAVQLSEAQGRELRILRAFYDADYKECARICDEVLDPSGALLGRVRQAGEVQEER